MTGRTLTLPSRRAVLVVALMATTPWDTTTKAGDGGAISVVAAQAVAQTEREVDDWRNDLGIAVDRLQWHFPGVEAALRIARERREEAKAKGDKAVVVYADRVLDWLKQIRRSEQLHLTLRDVIRRTLANNFTIQTVSYNPAIEMTRVIEAESVFDAVVFTNVTNANTDAPTADAISSSDAEFFSLNVGVRKILATGTQVNAQYDFTRSKQSFAFQLLNPAYRSNLILEMRQPFLRGFGVDFNRSLIVMAENNQHGSDLAFRRQIRDMLRIAEERYWRLVQARRVLVISARELADFEGIYDYLVARRDFDITPVQINTTLADLNFARAEFIGRRADVFDAEDQLIAVMNDPEINLVDDVEIIPDGLPRLSHLILDRVAEVQVALDNRTEIREQELIVANAKVSVGRAENFELPRLDMTFRTQINGLGESADDSFSDMNGFDFIDYIVGAEFEVPIGNRGPRASRRRAQLQHAQAVSQLRQTFEDVILDVNLSVRQIGTRYDQILPSFKSTEAREREVKSIVARAERKDLNTLNTELSARRGLAATRRAVLAVMIDYTIAIVDLERAKGTLLPYHGVIIPTEASSGKP